LEVVVELEGFIDASAMLSGGVYALVHRGVVVYVGKSKVMLGRVYSHRVAWGRKSQKAVGLKPIKGILFDAIWIRPCPSAEIDDLEYTMINLYKPRYNSLLRNGLPVPLPPDISALVASMLGTAVNVPTPAQNRGSIRRRV
jgi:hypothetical protein